MDVVLTLALAQVEGSPDPFRNLETARRHAHAAAEEGAAILVFPEMFMALPSPGNPPARLVRDAGGHFVEQLARMAQSFRICIVAGVWEPSPDPDRVYNTAVVLGPEGETLAAYRKLHLFDALNVRESKTMVAGDRRPPVVSIHGLRVGLAICYDLRFPELFRCLADQGAEAVLVPSAWYQGSMKEEHWLTLLRARAIENTFYVAGCNLIGGAFCGRSTVFDPFGVPVACAVEGEDHVTARISPRRVRSVREKLPSLENRRKDLF
uniref:Carbon-nitrogen hydrolase family protein n=1 Tax=Desulfacinum infernum TaxID=35837 RepID=A0A832EET2_9BACT